MRVIVVVKDDSSLDDVELNLTSVHGFEPYRRFDIFNLLAGDLPEDALESARQTQGVESIEPEQTFHTQN